MGGEATSVVIGALAVATGAYLAAVYLAADAHRLGERTLELDFRARAVLTPPHLPRKGQTHLLAAFAAATFLIGVGVTVFADGGWARVLGVICLFVCAISTFGLVTAAPDQKISLATSAQSRADHVPGR